MCFLHVNDSFNLSTIWKVEYKGICFVLFTVLFEKAKNQKAREGKRIKKVFFTLPTQLYDPNMKLACKAIISKNP